MPKYTLLILDSNQRSALASTRSLGTLSKIRVMTADSTTYALAGSSAYSNDYYQCPCPASQPSEFIHWLISVVEDNDITHIFPMTEVTSQLVLMHREQFHGIIIPFTNYETVMQLADKSQLTQLASKCGISYPETTYHENADSLISQDLPSFPFVIKPNLSRIWSDGHWINTMVHIVKDDSDFAKCISEPYIRNFPFMIQEFIPGHGAGAFALYDKGTPVAFFAHQRLREKPPSGGVSVLSQSVPLDNQLLEITRQLLDAVQWHGVAMVEFRIAEDGTPYLMEVNTRFWGSLQLAIDSGVDFPKLLFQISNGESPAVIEGYKEGQRLRWLLGDLDSLYIYLKDSRYSLPQKFGRILGFFTPVSGTRHEVNRWGDLGPAWFELTQYVKSLFGR